MTLTADNSRDGELVENRRLGQTNLGEKGHNGGPFSYVHLRVALPQPLEEQELFGSGAPESYFLMRRSHDGFVSSTGMFKASFPWARKVEEESEKQYVKTHFKNTSREETAGNVWVEPTDALILADEYGIRPWIEALLDNDTVLPSDNRKRNITPPPPFFRSTESDNGSIASAPPSSGTRRRSTRSMSPSKRIITPRKSRASRATPAKDSPLKKEIPSIIEREEEFSENISNTKHTTLVSSVLPNGNPPMTPVKESTVKVEVDEAVETNGDIQVKTTHVKVELPEGSAGEPPSAESTAQMIAKAREMVAEAQKLEDNTASVSKRKVEEVEDLSNGVVETEEEKGERKVKRTRGLEDQLRREKVKNRALLGLTATLAIGALLPYVL
ncbi:hypothetical protein EDC01DRAFT_717004 [Geopyxis carbonaria]|nr:hypothetical protein EDC01DRAFT_717004 [Geopyxis carbonaria]